MYPFPATELFTAMHVALQVVRVGEPAAMRDSLQQYSLDAKVQHADGFQHVRAYHAVLAVLHPDTLVCVVLHVQWKS